MSWRWLLAAALPLIASTATAQSPKDCPALGAALVDHSCFHSIFGPFETVRATAGTESSADTPKLDAVHTEFRVGLAGSVSSATYEPKRAGAWSVFQGSEIPLRLINDNGDELVPIQVFDGGTGCEGLPLATVFELEAKKRYQLQFGPTEAEHAIVVIEYLNDFLVANGRDADGDGYGDPDDTIVSNCVPPEGYVQNALDCDDTDATVNPGVPELCDGVDQNCNGLLDDEGLTCRTGEGNCQAVGEVFCEEPGAAVACTAVAGETAQETCDGEDDDCNGKIDDAEELCSDSDAPTCVRDRQQAFCGCLLDSDCGSRDSGRVCDSDERRCVAGCSTEPGRNGCPASHSCVVDDTTSECVPEMEPPDPSETSTTGGGAGGAGEDSETGGRTETVGGTEAEPVEAQTSRGCGCRTAGSVVRGHGGPAAVIVAAALAILRRRRERQTRPGTLALAAGLSLAACGGKTQEPTTTAGFDTSTGGMSLTDTALASSETGAPLKPPCEPVLAAAVVVHACSHTTNGPFVSVAAAATAPIADVSRLHTTFDVEVLRPEAELSYEPHRDGTHVFFSDAPVELRLFEGEQRVQGESFTTSGCQTASHGFSANLTEGARYRILIAEGSTPHFRLFIEHLGTFGDSAWEEDCSLEP